jgi:muconate cycloisomerase
MNNGGNLANDPGARVRRIEVTPVMVPFREFIRDVMKSSAGGLGMMIPAEEPWHGEDFVICRITSESGACGLGEAFVWLPETGTTPGQIIDVIVSALGRYVIGESPFDTERILRRMDNNATRNEVAKGLLDMACWDLAGRISGKPVYDLLGGRIIERVPLAALVPLIDAGSMTALALNAVESGHGTIRLKLGRSAEDDREITAEVRRAVGDRVRIRVDYNQAYSPEDAVGAINAIEPFGIELAEQPVRADDYLGMAFVQERVGVPLMAHEGCFSLKDLLILLELGAIGVVGINSERPGGVTNALKAIDFAVERGMGVVLHNQTLGIADAVHLHLAAARHKSRGLAAELYGHVMLEDDLITNPLDFSDGMGTVPDKPGWGVDLDEEALKRYATGPTVVIGK